MEEGEEGAEIQDQGLAQATAASESRDATEKDGAGNQDSEEENHEEEEDQTGNSWGHAKLPGDVYGSSPFLKSGRNKQHVVWDDVKFLKKHTAQGTTVHEKYTHVCVARITAAKAGEEGEDEDGEGNWRWYCNKLLKLRKGKNCYNTTQATAHIKKHGDGTEAGKALCTRAEKDNTHRGAVMEAASSKTKAGQPSGAALTYSISREEMCIGKMARW